MQIATAIAVLAVPAFAGILDVPFVRQTREGCGSAAVAMVLQYWAREIPGLGSAALSAETVAREMNPGPGGLSGESLRQYFDAHNFSAFVFIGDVADLRGHTAKGRPVIVCLGPARAAELHFVVVAGVDAGNITLNDPARGKWIREPIKEFERQWKASDGWALLALPHGQRVVDSAVNLARADRLEDAERALRSAMPEYPDDKRFPIELAGVMYREKRYAAAKSFLSAGIKLDPADAYANEFLGTLYLREGNLAAALKHWNLVGKPLIQEVRFTQPDALDPVLRARAVTFSGGQILTPERLRETEANLDRLDIFASWKLQLIPDENQRYDAVIDARPSVPFLPLASGLAYETLFIDRYNIAHKGIRFNSLWRWDVNKRRIGMELAGPLQSDPRYGYRLVLDGRDEMWNLSGTHFRLRRVETGGDVNVALTPRLEWSAGVRAVGRSIDLFAGGWSFEAPVRFDYRLFDSPEHRVRIDVATGFRPGHFIGAYGTATGDLRAKWQPAGWEIGARFRGARSYGTTPFDEFAQLAMERDNDLWFRGIVGTRDGQKGNAPLGVNYTLTQMDVDRTVFHLPFVELKAGPFFDVAAMSGVLTATGVQARVGGFGRTAVTLVYGHNLSDGRGVFYTAVSR